VTARITGALCVDGTHLRPRVHAPARTDSTVNSHLPYRWVGREHIPISGN